MNEFKTCDLCVGFDGNSLAEKLKELDSNATIELGCQGMCAIGMSMPFVIVNGMPITAENEEEILEKVKEIIKK